MQIKKLKSSDVKKALKCMKKADDRFDSYDDKKIEKYLKKPGHPILMAIIDDKFAGYVGLIREDDDSRVEKMLDLKKFLAVSWIGVVKKHRKKHIGSKLLKACEKYVKIFDKKGIWLDCREDKLPFYKKNGYKNVGYFMKKGHRQYVMLKRVK